MKKSILIAGGIAAVITGCTSTPPLPSERNRFELEVAQQVCTVDALAEEKQTALSVANDSMRSIARYQNKYGQYTEQTDTILSEKLNYYEAEIEASYKFVTQHCGAFMRCLEQNRQFPARCQNIEASWNKSQDRFNTLAREIRLIAASVERERIRAQSRRRGHGRGHSHGHGQGGCCSTINSIFTDCCG